MGGPRRAVLLPERDQLPGRIAAAPDLTVRGLRAELAERGTKVSSDAVSYDAVWRFLRNARISFKEKPARRRAGSARRCPKARAVEAPPGPG